MLNLDLSALEIFRQVALDGSITRAASNLNRVQSNISVRIRQLEERLGTELFSRHRRGLVLTDEGRILLGYADRLLGLSLEAMDAVGNRDPQGSFRIGTMESTAAARLPEILSRYHAAHPSVEVNLKTDTAGGLLRLLATQEIDAAFVAEPVDIPGVRMEAVFEERLILVAPKSVPVIGRYADLNGATIIAFEEGCAYRRYLNEWLLEEGITPGKTMSVASYLAILACVSAGTGFAVVPASVLAMIDTRGEFATYDLPGRYSKIKTLLVWRDNYRSPKLDALRSVLPNV